jgi:hypothetical protein
MGFILSCDLCRVVAGQSNVDLTVHQPGYRGVQQLFLIADCCGAIAAMPLRRSGRPGRSTPVRARCLAQVGAHHGCKRW